MIYDSLHLVIVFTIFLKWGGGGGQEILTVTATNWFDQ